MAELGPSAEEKASRVITTLMSLIVLLCLLFGIAAVLLLVLYSLQRRQLTALQHVSGQVQRIAIGGSLRSKLDFQTDQPELSVLVTAVNHLLARASAAADRPRQATTTVSSLGDRVHESVLIHGSAIRYANPQFANLLGKRVDEVVGSKLQDLVPLEYADLVVDNMRRRLAGEATAERYEVEVAAPGGLTSRLELSSWPFEYDGEHALLIIGVEVVPTQSVRALQMPEGSQPRRALESLTEALLTTDAEGRVDYMNPAAARLLSVEQEQAIGQTLDELATVVDESDRKLLAEPVRQALTASTPLTLGRRALLIRAPGAAEHLVELSAAPMRQENGETIGAVLLLHDVTEVRGLTRQMSYQATHDALTGLVNRREFERRLQEAVDTAQRGDGTHVLCYLDLDRFKEINDAGGHGAGDAMLREAAKILREAVRDSDTLARIGGDEFGMLLVGCPLEKARQIADDVCRVMNEFRFTWREQVFNVGVSIGLVELARDSGTLEEALAAADSACYVAKRQGSHVAVYSARDESFARRTGEIQWLQTLQSALRESRFDLYAQPIIAANAGNDEGPAMEVLVRLRDETTDQSLSATEFVRAAERYRLMALVDRWVVQTTLNALGRGALALPPKRSVAINISGQTLADTQFMEFVVECFDATGANPEQVCFEISENAAVANAEQTRRFVGVLHGMGCRFALDDFGSGLGSFNNLKSLAVDYLKIDGSFFRNLSRDTVNQAMVTAMIRLARSLNFKVIAEQVEDSASLETARRMGVDYLQGYAIGRPEKLMLAA
jgi:diguanylate cyclase (GGDEF)-like protein/PAS domain S-box-containing protein